MKRGILLAAFGARNPDAQLSLERFADEVRLSFPDIPVRWAFTSGIIRHRLAGEGIKTDSVQKALDKMWFEKFTHVAVQSLHVVPGVEFNDLRDTALAMRGKNREKGFAQIEVGAPLLSTRDDAAAAAKAIIRHQPAERREDEPLLMMGHGTWHAGDSMYEILAEYVTELDPNIHIATMDGANTIHDLAPRLSELAPQQVWMMPLLAVAGAHVTRDMVGKRPDSWKSIIESLGIACRPILNGAAEFEGFAAIWMAHLKAALGKIGA